jgi:hypothetical protein
MNLPDKCIVSKISDNNIFHIFVFDIIKLYTPTPSHIYIEDNINIKHPCQLWRLFVLKKLYPNAKISILKDIQYKSEYTYKGYDCWKFIKYPIDKHVYEIINKINSKEKGEYILLNQRSTNDRHMYDANTKLPLEEYLLAQEFTYPVKICNFETLKPEEQFAICSKAKIFISAHGAGCTNLIFTPPECPLIEVNFRKHWYCDNVCDDHFLGKISINDKCNGKLNYRPEFHKADYHNLCYLINKHYTEIQAEYYGGIFKSRSPISKTHIYIDDIVILFRIILSGKPIKF